MTEELKTIAPRKWSEEAEEKTLEIEQKKCNVCLKEKDKLHFRTKLCKRNNTFYTSNICLDCTHLQEREHNNTKYATNKKFRIKVKERANIWTKNNPLRYKYSQYKYRALDRSYSFHLTIEQFSNIIIKPCHYCGEEVSEGIDRKDNSIGYEIENCLPCCALCNFAKRNMGYNEFIGLVCKIYNNLAKLGDT